MKSDVSALPVATRSWAIEFDHVSVTYSNGTKALDDISLTINPGEMVAIVGLSGSGKSTLIRTINGLVPVTAGSVTVGPHQINALSGKTLRTARGQIGMIFQGFNLSERSTVFHNVLVGRFAHTAWWRNLLGRPTAEDKSIAFHALDAVGILDKAWVRAHALSGGQKQRVAIARALSQDPSVMLADEPVASLDPPTAHSVMRDLEHINNSEGITVLVNLHLIDLARQYTTRLIGLRAGKLVYDGLVADATDADFEAIYGRPIQAKDLLGERE
ncbi:phosphonate ABC transporter ATP-binding protein [Corynebacterium crudilactis]|uniref:Phosphonate ABC transporter ATP-binding protein n=1 Tax=Corynebacterium crudilactis TaxID=1652495 RepID=A0A172QTH5_9CORY|nr:phosphonate ABC transporter ATP-binding protein [Corynebacterium crudilactis]ANE03993.1 phosphonate ABC transporter ATP-binding protein [Corynebacterium crudilactis]